MEQFAVFDDAFFWLDVFAVPQHHPADTPGAIRDVVAVLQVETSAE